MRELRLQILTKWAGTTKYLTDLQSDDYESLFKLYDELVFSEQIQKRIAELASNGTMVAIEFNADPESVPEHARRWCGVILIPDIDYYSVQISPWIVSRISNATEKDRSHMFGTRHSTEAILIAFEHQLSHLLALLWNQVGPLRDPDHEIYGVHGKLFRCTTDEFFEPHVSNIMIELTDPAIIPSPPKADQHGRYSYWSNSCNIDSLMSILLFSDTPVFRNAIFGTNVATTKYSIEEQGMEIFKLPCPEGSIIQTEELWRDLAARMQARLFDDYMSMIKNKIIECRPARRILRECYPDMKERGSWTAYNIAEIYALIAEMFPSLLYTDLPYNRIEPGHAPVRQIFSGKKPLFTFWEYMDSFDDIEVAAQDYIWDEFDQEILVFRNGAVPPIVNFGSTKSEIVKVTVYKRQKKIKKVKHVELPPDWERWKSTTGRFFYFNEKTGLSVWDPPSGSKVKMIDETVGETMAPVREKKEIKKARAFGEFIIGNKYEMIGAAILQGSSASGHYIAYIKTSDGWYYYNDVGNYWRKLEKFPSEVLKERNGNKPEMYFYRRT